MTPLRKRIFISLFFGLLLLALAGGCAPARQSPPDEVVVQFSWFHNMEFAGFYVADQNGYYVEENLQVTLQDGGPTADPMGAVSSGAAHFGTTAGDNLIRAQTQGGDAVAVASVFRQSPLIVMALAEDGITHPRDLEGLTVGVISPNLDTTWDIQFLAMLERLGVDAESMTFVPMEDYHGANEMTSGHVDVASSFFSTNEPVAADLDGVAYTSLFYSDYGVVIYANPIFTSQRLIQDQPELIERFVRATLRGYQFAVENPQEAAEMILSYSEGLNLEHETATMVSQIPLIDTGDVPIGWMDADVWQTTQEVLLEQGVIDQAVDLNAVYTNRFVEAAQP